MLLRVSVRDMTAKGHQWTKDLSGDLNALNLRLLQVDRKKLKKKYGTGTQ